MKRILIICTIVVIASLSGIGTVVAQSDNVNQTNTQTPEPETNNEVMREISSNVVLRNIQWDFENETVWLEFDSSYAENIVITDALITSDRTSALNRQTYEIDGETMVRFDAEKYNRKMAITVDGDQLYPFMESDSLLDFDQDYTSQQVAIAIIFGGFLGIGIVFGASYKREMDMSDEVERVT